MWTRPLAPAMQETGFAFVEHTADLGLRAWGPTLDEAFAQAARGMMAYILDDPSRVRPQRAWTLSLQRDTPERLLLEFLDELNFLVLTEGALFSEVRVHLDAAGLALTAEARGEPHDETRHGHVHEIKAMTFHDIRVTREPPEVFIIFDI